MTTIPEPYCEDCGEDISVGGYQYQTGEMKDVPHPWRKTETVKRPEVRFVCKACFDLWEDENFCEHKVSLDFDCGKCSAAALANEVNEGSSISFPIRTVGHIMPISKSMIDDAEIGTLKRMFQHGQATRHPVVVSTPGEFTIRKSNHAIEVAAMDIHRDVKKARDIGDVYYENGKLWYWDGSKALPVKIEGEQ